jgi:uncharacterized Zn-finger protein
VHLYIKDYFRVKLVNSSDGKDNDAKDFSGHTNNFLHSLCSQCGVTLNGVSVTSVSGLYNYHAYFETLLTYGRDAVTSHVTNSMSHLDDGDMLFADSTIAATNETNSGFMGRWNRSKQSKEIELFGRLHSDLCNEPRLLPPGV